MKITKIITTSLSVLVGIMLIASELMIIIAMARGNNRFTELQRMVKGISARVLSSELKELELNGFIIKKVSVGYPVSITYELLPYSESLEEVVGALSRWGILHREKIKSDMKNNLDEK